MTNNTQNNQHIAPDKSNGCTITVPLDDRSYPIHIASGAINHAGQIITNTVNNCNRAIIVSDNIVSKKWLTPLQKSLHKATISHNQVIIPAGEESKSFAYLENLLTQLLDLKPDRNTTLIALGGGVVGDITGFAASILLRGVPYVQIPTSFLAQIDSSVGGKTGINTKHGKNLIGSFYQPRCVIIDTNTLSSLPVRQLRAGYSELVKYGCINDANFFAWLEINMQSILSLNANALQTAIKTACSAKTAIISLDETESGQRALLNLGHTFGHALEKATDFSDKLLHGEAVAIGMVMAFDYSVRNNLCPQNALERLRNHLQNANLPISAHHLQLTDSVEYLISCMEQDKKAVNQKMTFILVRDIGHAFITQNVNKSALRSLLMDYV